MDQSRPLDLHFPCSVVPFPISRLPALKNSADWPAPIADGARKSINVALNLTVLCAVSPLADSME